MSNEWTFCGAGPALRRNHLAIRFTRSHNKKMDKRNLGRSGIAVSALCFGT
jgi:hypothetical protein